MFYELAASSWGQEEVQALERVLRSGRLTMGEEVAAFEREFAAYIGRRHGVMVNSGSSANLIATAALFYKRMEPLQRGDQAIVPAIAWSTTYHPLQQYGLGLRVVDVDLNTLNIDTSKLEPALTPRTRLLVGVSILGNPAPLDRLCEFSDNHGLYLLEDNCESMDAELHGRKTGSFGLLSTFSFFFSHHISTVEGGMVLTDDEELFHLLLSLRAHGWTRDLPPGSPLFVRGEDDVLEAYRFILPGYNVRPLEFTAAIGREQLKKLPAMTYQRRQNLKLFKELFDGDDRFITQVENGASSSFAFTIVLSPRYNIDRNRVFTALRNANIGFRLITGGCFTCHDVVRYYGFEVVDSLANAEQAHYHGFFVGNQPFDLSGQIRRLRSVLDQACRPT